LKSINSALKVLLSIGGWNFNDCGGAGASSCNLFSDMVSTPANRATFISNVVAFLVQHHFDGIDIDWEYPVVAGHNGASSTPEDKSNLVILIKEMRDTFRTNGLLVTAAVGIGKSTVDQAYDVPSLCDPDTGFDWINLMAYDMHGAWEPITGHHTSLYATTDDETAYGYPVSVSWAVDYWLELGCSSKKLTLGLATYGKTFQLSPGTSHGMLVSASGAGNAGPGTREKGMLAYAEIQTMINNNELIEVWDQARGVPYAYSSSGMMVAYDNERSVGLKCDLIKSKDLLGGMNWALDLDEFKKGYTLLAVVKSKLLINTSPAEESLLAQHQSTSSSVVFAVVGVVSGLVVVAAAVMIYRTRRNGQEQETIVHYQV